MKGCCVILKLFDKYFKGLCILWCLFYRFYVRDLDSVCEVVEKLVEYLKVDAINAETILDRFLELSSLVRFPYST